MSNDQSTPRLVRDLMTVGVPTCPAAAPVVEVARLILEKDWEGVCVLDHEGHAVGVISREDLVTAYAFSRINADTRAEDIMDEQVIELPPDIPLTVAAQLMQDHKTRVVFLMHNAAGIIYPAAYLSYKHFIRHITATSDEDLKDLGIEAERESPVETFIKKRDAARQNASEANEE